MTIKEKAREEAQIIDAQATKETVAKILKVDLNAARQHAVAAQLFDLIGNMAADGTRRDDPLREIFSRLGNRWSLLLLFLLRIGTFRHSVLRRLASALSGDKKVISQHMLTLCLRALERDGFIMRNTIAGRFPNVEYSITPLGLGLMEEIDHVFSWIRRNKREILDARQRFQAAD